jgi:hypothetical protein
MACPRFAIQILTVQNWRHAREWLPLPQPVHHGKADNGNCNEDQKGE